MASEPSEKTRLKESDWALAVSLWERGEVTLRELSERFGVTEAAISQGLKRRGAKRGSKAHLTHREVEKTLAEERKKLAEEVFNFKRKYIRYGDFLMTLTMNLITEAKKDDKKLFSVKTEIETVIAATKVYKTIRNDMFHLYDLYNTEQDEGEQLDFNIGVYTESDIQALRESQEIMARMMNQDDEDVEPDTEE